MPTKSEAPYPYLSINGEFMSKESLDAVWVELSAKIPVWEAGLEVPNSIEKFAYIVLRSITLRKPEGL